MKINKDYAQLTYNVDYLPNRKINYVVIHNTATDAPAENACLYFGRADRNASADYFINKDGSICQFNADPTNYYSWHCGDGRGAYGITNPNSIGIEVVSAGEEFTDAQKQAVKELVAFLRGLYGNLTLARHYDASRKICPMYYTNNPNAWAELVNYINDTTPAPMPTSGTFRIRVLVNDYKYYAEPNVNSTVKGIAGKGAYTITETSGVWGKLKSGAGWVDLSNPTRVELLDGATIPQDAPIAPIDETFLVRIDISDLRIRKGAGTNYPIVSFIPKGVYTIIETSAGTGASLWGKLKSGAGWIALDYVTRL